MEQALKFLKEHYEVAFATCEGDKPVIRISVLPRLYTSYDKPAYFKLPIALMDYYDLNPTPPVNKHFDLENHTEANG